MDDPSFHLGKAVNVLNIILNYLYLGLLIMCFLLSLGNRPQGAKWPYTFAFIGFAVITIYMTVSHVYIVCWTPVADFWHRPLRLIDSCLLPSLQRHRQFSKVERASHGVGLVL